MRFQKNARQIGSKILSELQLFFVTEIKNIVFVYEQALNEEWKNKFLVENQFTYVDDKLLRYLSDSLKSVNFSIDDKDVIYQGLDFEGVNTLYPNQIANFKKVILDWIRLFENDNQTFDLNRFNQAQTFDKPILLKELNKLVKLCKIVENNPNKCLVHIGL